MVCLRALWLSALLLQQLHSGTRAFLLLGQPGSAVCPAWSAFVRCGCVRSCSRSCTAEHAPAQPFRAQPFPPAGIKEVGVAIEEPFT